MIMMLNLRKISLLMVPAIVAVVLYFAWVFDPMLSIFLISSYVIFATVMTKLLRLYVRF